MDDDKHCWCPCGHYMLPWRNRFDLNEIVSKYTGSTDCGSRARFTPVGLMAHLEAKKMSCLLHFGVHIFLMELYGDLRGTGHKTLFKAIR